VIDNHRTTIGHRAVVVVAPSAFDAFPTFFAVGGAFGSFSMTALISNYLYLYTYINNFNINYVLEQQHIV